MGKNNPGVRDGTGPHKNSLAKRRFGKGRRKELGEECPFDSKKLERGIKL